MSRTLSATVSAAVAEETTQPVYLIDMAWDTPVKAATWDTNISWNGDTWIASGLHVTGLSANGGSLIMPKGDSDPWLALVMGEIPRNRTISVYEYHTDFTVSPNVSDAQLLFSGYMDGAVIGTSIRVTLIESAIKKAFPPTDIDRPIYTHLLSSGTVLRYGNDVVTVQ